MGFAIDDGTPLEDKVASTVQAIVEIAVELGSSLAVIERNTREIFWWTSWAISVVLGLFILHLLVKVSAQLEKLNTYQAVFLQMWTEDRENEERDRNQRRERYNIAMRSVLSAQGTRGESRAEIPLEDWIDELSDAAERIGPLPEEGTPEYEELLQELRGMRRQRG
ncbi:hypothetical protein F5Y12DRAFT_712587 [Xylaria sp. FL1777]|nr:hypothetical protein F5Y12DRAFT_712587 [Xylaria sp. FL1777]